jgi:hypothetical protein
MQERRRPGVQEIHRWPKWSPAGCRYTERQWVGKDSLRSTPCRTEDGETNDVAVAAVVAGAARTLMNACC